MSASNIKLTTWLSKGTYPRLYVPIVLVILVVVVVRYHFLIESEVAEARQRWVTEINRMGHFVLPVLARMPMDAQAIEKKLIDEIRYTPELESLTWQVGTLSVATKSQPLPTPAVPAWFANLAHSERIEKQFKVILEDGQLAQLRVTVWPDASAEDIWKVVSSQMGISALNVITILVALALLLRANARMLKRLKEATVGFQSGYLDTRMEVKGTLEVQTVANTFNAMADQIGQLINSLQTSESEQADQLHFTRQLVNAFPLPVFVRSVRDICLVVNPAWENMFGIRAESVVGKPMPSHFSDLEHDVIDITAAEQTDDGTGKGTLQEVHRFYINGETRRMLYFRAPFFNRNNVQLGTIATLVDITDRERDDPLTQWAESRSGVPSVH